MKFIRACLALAAITLASAARADAISDFYSGKTITLVVGSDTGGGYDTNARVLARHLGNFIPGNPRIVVQNMPGAGSIVATNYLYNVAPKDGTAFGLIQRGNMLADIVRQPVQFNLRKIDWIGNLAVEPGLVVSWHTSPIRTYKDVFEREFVVGGSGLLGENETVPRILNAVAGAKFRIVAGYPSNSAILVAMERGEVMGVGDWTWSNIKTRKPDFLRDKKINLLFQIGMEKEPDLPDVPMVRDFARAPMELRAVDTIMSLRSVARPLMVPPGLPPERLAALRAAFSAMAKDAAFIADADKAGIEASPTSGEEVDKIAKFIADTPDEAARLLARAILPNR